MDVCKLASLRDRPVQSNSFRIDINLCGIEFDIADGDIKVGGGNSTSGAIVSLDDGLGPEARVCDQNRRIERISNHLRADEHLDAVGDLVCASGHVNKRRYRRLLAIRVSTPSYCMFEASCQQDTSC